MEHIHVNATEFLIFVAQLILAGFLLRTYMTFRADHPDGKALAWIF